MRASNIELLRIIAMLFVVLLHCNFAAIGYPSAASVSTAPLQEIIKMFFENICIVSVNCFILISGYFSLRLSLQRLVRFWLQCFFYGVLIYIVVLLLKIESFSLAATLTNTILWWLRDNWFICCYFALMLLAPIVNLLFERAEVKQLRLCLLLLLVVDCVLGWFVGMKGNGTAGGYSVFHLLVVYYLGRFIYIVNQDEKPVKRSRFYLLSFIGLVVLNTILAYVQIRCSLPLNMFSYNAPVVLLACVYFFMFFLYLDVKNSKLINFVAKSSFSVFLIHIHPLVFPLFKSYMCSLLENFGGGYYVLLSIVVALSLYGLSIVVDLMIRPIVKGLPSKLPSWEIKEI